MSFDRSFCVFVKFSRKNLKYLGWYERWKQKNEKYIIPIPPLLIMTRKISYNNSYQSEAKLVNLDGSINFSDECVGGVEADRSSQEPRRNRTTFSK